jgi:MSHA pilin protein MshD
MKEENGPLSLPGHADTTHHQYDWAGDRTEKKTAHHVSDGPPNGREPVVVGVPPDGARSENLAGRSTGFLRRYQPPRCFWNQAGLTLVELIVAMVVISVALVGVLSVITYTTRHSADPVLRHQAIALAEAYMEEIVLREFRDPDTGLICPAAEGSRGEYDNICDYNGLTDSQARNQNGQAIAGLENYRVRVAVGQDPFGPAGNLVAGLRIDVEVTDPAGQTVRLRSYRAEY